IKQIKVLRIRVKLTKVLNKQSLEERTKEEDRINPITDLLKVNKIFCFLGIIFCVSCDSNKEYDSYQTLKEGVWGLKDRVLFEVEVKDTVSLQNVFLNVRTDVNYPYRNLYVISKMSLPSGLVLIDTLEYEMADAFGNLLGDGFTDVKNNKLYYLENHQFSQQGMYVFEFYQAMRKRGEIHGLEGLEGVVDVGLRIEKTQD
ncbi:MAG: gliding motility lipoprotein GldH, partial [Wenyingzhuangia sp.]|uniref:gliding motility lipoprotein GldH n=1 Tax=Wenyingzhuangia sp. TaxID=1964193 RepID=UPI00321BD3FB